MKKIVSVIFLGFTLLHIIILATASVADAGYCEKARSEGEWFFGAVPYYQYEETYPLSVEYGYLRIRIDTHNGGGINYYLLYCQWDAEWRIVRSYYCPPNKTCQQDLLTPIDGDVSAGVYKVLITPHSNNPIPQESSGTFYLANYDDAPPGNCTPPFSDF
jgi:hypothetical protein